MFKLVQWLGKKENKIAKTIWLSRKTGVSYSMIKIEELKAIITENAEGAEAGSAQAQIAVVNAEAELDKLSRLSHSSRTTLTDWEKKVLKQLAPVRKAWDEGLFN